MLAVALLYTGLIAVLTGLVALFIRWRTGLAIVGGGLVLGAIGLLLPAGETRVPAIRTRLDEFAPAYQFHEVHTTRVEAPCERTYQALKEVTAPEIAFFRALTWIRRMGRPGPESILNAPERIPLLDLATRTGFLWLADVPNQEIVIGTLVVVPADAGPRPTTAERFKALDRPGYAKAAMNFLLTPEGADRCTVKTETRVYATDASTRSDFRVYWRMIFPGSAVIRRMWLRAVKHRAEA